MSRYVPLWKYITLQNTDCIKLTFAQIEQITGAELNHSFLTCKKELLDYGWNVSKISMKTQTVMFERQPERLRPL